MIRRPPGSTLSDPLCPYTTLFRFAFQSGRGPGGGVLPGDRHSAVPPRRRDPAKMSVDKISPAGLRLRGGMLSGETKPVLGLLVLLAGRPLVLQGYIVYILPQYMTFGIAAMSLGLLWGRAGILSFGQAAFFALGAYAMGLVLPLVLPVNGGYLGLLAAFCIGAAVAGISGYFLFKAGVRATYFEIGRAHV